MKILVTGAAGMLGGALVRELADSRPDAEVIALTRAEVDLSNASSVITAIASAAPDAVIHAAARVAGIAEKTEFPFDFLSQNLVIDNNVIGGSLRVGVKELLYVSSAAIYPAESEQPIPESAIHTGALEEANASYGLAKSVGIALCENASKQGGLAFRSVVPSNLYGPGDSYRPGRSHLVASAIHKIHEAKKNGHPAVEVWGDGTARREFAYVPDLAHWMVAQIGRLASLPTMINVGPGTDHSIADYYEAVARTVDYPGELVFDASKPSGVPRRLLDSSAARSLGWEAPTDLEQGLRDTYEHYLRTTKGTS